MKQSGIEVHCPACVGSDPSNEKTASKLCDGALDGSLAKPLRFDDFIARRFSLDLSAIEPGGVVMTFSAAPDDGIDLTDLMSAFENTLQAIADEGIPEATFDRIKKKQLAGLEASKGKRGTAIDLVINQVADEATPIDSKTYIKRYGAITLDDVNALVRALAGDGDVAARLVSPHSSN